MSSIKVSSVYLDGLQVPYETSVEIINTNSGDAYSLGPVSPDSMGWFPLKGLLKDGQTFTVTFIVREIGDGVRVEADHTVITYDANISVAAAYSGSGSLLDPLFKYVGTVVPPASSLPKVNALYVANYQQYGDGSVLVTDAKSGEGYRLGSATMGTSCVDWWPLSENLEEDQKFLFSFEAFTGAGTNQVGPILAYGQDSTLSATFSVNPEGYPTYTGLVTSSQPLKLFSEISTRVNSVHVNDIDAPYGASIQLIHTTSGDVYPLGAIKPDSKGSYSLEKVGLAAGQTFTITLQADEGGAKADTTVITYDKSSSLAAAYSGSGSLKEPSFKYIGIIHD